MKKLVKHPDFRPAVLIGRFKEKGQWYVRVEWTNIPKGDGHLRKRAPVNAVFLEKDVKITRCKFAWERKLIKFFNKHFKK